jgi:hypothetical protein
MVQKTTDKTSNALKNIDFVAWQISRAKSKMRCEEINRIFSGRTRLRSKNHLN